MKVFKLARAEIKKIFLRPVMWLMFLILSLSLVVLTFVFKPMPRTTTNLNVYGTTVQDAKNNFDAEYYNQINNSLIDCKNNITDYLTKIESEDRLALFKSKIAIAETDKLNFTNLVTNFLAGTKTANDVVEGMDKLKSSSQDVLNFLNIEVNTQITFYISEGDYNYIFSFFERLINNIPSSPPSSQFIIINEFITENFSFTKITPILEKLTKIPIKESDFQPFLAKYYDEMLNPLDPNDLGPRLNKLYDDIIQYSITNGSFADEQYLIEINEMFSQYNSIAKMTSSVLINEFYIAKSGNKSDSELRQYISFEDYNSYFLKQESERNKFLLEEGKFDFNYLMPFSFNQQSSQQTNAYDFLFFAMQILSLIITLFSIFVASGTIANEQSTGTLKMIAIRPYSRSKIVFAKFLACITFMTILLVIFSISAFVVGWVSYGIPTLNVLTVFDAQNVLVLQPYLHALIYIFSIFLNMVFYISLALLISVILKSNTLAIMLSLIFYAISIIGNVILYKTTWFYLFPIAHFDLYKYFGSSSNIGNYLDFIIPVNANFTLSITYLLCSSLLFLILSLIIFKKRNIA